MYDPASGTWTLTGKMVWSRSPALVRDAEATLLLDGRVLVTGEDGAQLYDPVTGTWTATQSDGHAALLSARRTHTAT